MSAARAVQRAMVAALEAVPFLTGIFDGAPPRAAFPYVTVGDALTTDWSTKTGAGREIRASAIVWDDGEQPARLHALMAAAEAALIGLAGAHDGWRIVSCNFLRSLIARDPSGPWSGLIEVRVRAEAI